MTTTRASTLRSRASRGPSHRVRLPGFLIDDVGLGDVIKRATAFVGIKSCGGCQRRAAALNSWVAFTGRSR